MEHIWVHSTDSCNIDNDEATMSILYGHEDFYSKSKNLNMDKVSHHLLCVGSLSKSANRHRLKGLHCLHGHDLDE